MRRFNYSSMALVFFLGSFLSSSAFGDSQTAGITVGSNDARETVSNGTCKVDSKSLDLGVNSDPAKGAQYCGFRYCVNVPQGATITAASIQFTSMSNTSDAADLTVKAEASDSAAIFGTNAYNVSSRPTTTASVSWNPPAWAAADLAGADQKTPDLTAVVQEVVNRAGWSSGNYMAFIISGSGTRIVYSYEGSNYANTAQLYVEWATGGGGGSTSGPRGVPESWCASKGLSTNDLAATENDDPDFDGMPTWKEYYAGTDPTDPNSKFEVTGIAVQNGEPTITWYGSTNNGPTTPFHVYRSTDIATGTWELISGDLARSDSAVNSWSDSSPPSGGTAFYRAVVSTN